MNETNLYFGDHFMTYWQFFKGYPWVLVLGINLILNNSHQCSCTPNFRLLSVCLKFFINIYVKLSGFWRPLNGFPWVSVLGTDLIKKTCISH
jgi:hypothetical protein